MYVYSVGVTIRIRFFIGVYTRTYTVKNLVKPSVDFVIKNNSSNCLAGENTSKLRKKKISLCAFFKQFFSTRIVTSSYG